MRVSKLSSPWHSLLNSSPGFRTHMSDDIDSGTKIRLMPVSRSPSLDIFRPIYLTTYLSILPNSRWSSRETEAWSPLPKRDRPKRVHDYLYNRAIKRVFGSNTFSVLHRSFFRWWWLAAKQGRRFCAMSTSELYGIIWIMCVMRNEPLITIHRGGARRKSVSLGIFLH